MVDNGVVERDLPSSFDNEHMTEFKRTVSSVHVNDEAQAINLWLAPNSTSQKADDDRKDYNRTKNTNNTDTCITDLKWVSELREHLSMLRLEMKHDVVESIRAMHLDLPTIIASRLLSNPSVDPETLQKRVQKAFEESKDISELKRDIGRPWLLPRQGQLSGF